MVGTPNAVLMVHTVQEQRAVKSALRATRVGSVCVCVCVCAGGWGGGGAG